MILNVFKSSQRVSYFWIQNNEMYADEMIKGKRLILWNPLFLAFQPSIKRTTGKISFFGIRSRTIPNALISDKCKLNQNLVSDSGDDEFEDALDDQEICFNVPVPPSRMRKTSSEESIDSSGDEPPQVCKTGIR